MISARIVGLARSAGHAFSKAPCERLTLIAGLGVEHDAHAGVTVQHLSRIRMNPDQPNLRQVHLLHAELFDELRGNGFAIESGDLGENLTTSGIDLLGLPTHTRLQIGDAVVRLTGLRNPCGQIEAFRPGLLAQMVEKRPDGTLNRKCGVMGVVEHGGEIAVGMPIAVALPATPHHVLEPV